MRRWLAVLGAGLLAACVPSFHPLYQETDDAFEADLLGEWHDDQGQPAFEFAKAGAGYDVVYRGGDEPARFEGRLVKLAGRTFMDLYPHEQQGERNDLLAAHLVPAHLVFRVELSSAELRLASLDPIWTQELLEKDPAALRHERRAGGILLTAATPELRAFFETHGGDEGAFPEPGLFRRREP